MKIPIISKIVLLFTVLTFNGVNIGFAEESNSKISIIDQWSDGYISPTVWPDSVEDLLSAYLSQSFNCSKMNIDISQYGDRSHDGYRHLLGNIHCSENPITVTGYAVRNPLLNEPVLMIQVIRNNTINSMKITHDRTEGTIKVSQFYPEINEQVIQL